MADVAEKSTPAFTITVDQLRAIVREEIAAAARPSEQEVLTREQAAKLLQVHPSVVTRYVRTEGLPGTKMGAEWRFRRSEIVQWLKEKGLQRGAPLEEIAGKLRRIKEEE